jgi:hypothetical protein
VEGTEEIPGGGAPTDVVGRGKGRGMEGTVEEREEDGGGGSGPVVTTLVSGTGVGSSSRSSF